MIGDVFRPWLAGLLFCLVYSSTQSQISVSATQMPSLIGLSPEVANLGAGCATAKKVPIPKRALIDIENVCKPAKWRIGPEPPQTCPGRSVPLLGVRFRGQNDLVLAESIALSSQHFHIRLYGPLEDVHGDSRDVTAIQRIEWCVGDSAPTDPVGLPADSCREPRQFAVSFDYGTPFNNKILTNGFSIYIRVSGNPPGGFDFDKTADDVLASFGRALTIWTAALQDNDALLTPATRAFIRARVSSSSGGYTLLTPPQVVRLHCPHSATFIVELNFGGDEAFPTQSLFLTLAKARLEGRTIALNMRDVTCFKTMPEFTTGQLTLRDEHCVNLLPILTHELGHAFGLDHISDAKGWALMNPVLSDHATVPTKLDVSALVSALERSVTGARPGELEFRAAAGLRAPADWKPEL